MNFLGYFVINFDPISSSNCAIKAVVISAYDEVVSCMGCNDLKSSSDERDFYKQGFDYIIYFKPF